jgi:UDP-N-acetylmuramate dehydrogenase
MFIFCRNFDFPNDDFMIFQQSVSLKPYNTFGIDATCRYFVELKQRDDVEKWVTMQQQSHDPFFILGGGSNVVFQQWIEKTVVKVSLRGIEIVKEDTEHVWIEAAAGEAWSDFVNYCVDNEWGGVENLSNIPGTVGAAPVQNVGAYGVEAKDVIEAVECIEIATGQWKKLTNAECKFGYRDSIFKQAFKNQYIITAVTFRLTKKPNLQLSYGGISSQLEREGIEQPTIADVSRVVHSLRVNKLPDPALIGSAGSFFKNPIVTHDKFVVLLQYYTDLVAFPLEGSFKIAAGWLIEQCGWKGKQLGRVGVYPQQALVLYNLGGCTGEEVKQLANAIQQSVKEKFDIDLEQEAIFIE